MERLMPIFRSAPIILFTYGAASAVVQLSATHATIESVRFGAVDIPSGRLLMADAYLQSVDSFFFYTGFAALVAVAVAVAERKG